MQDARCSVTYSCYTRGLRGNSETNLPDSDERTARRRYKRFTIKPITVLGGR